MCLMIPSKIVKINKNKAVIDYGGEKREANIIGKRFKKGDYVVVQGGVVIEKVPEKEAIEAIENLKRFV